ncbi:peptide deformylase, putative [Plasmodium ovale curtisi]|uniref:Peptide deformylase n=1 Tax=Plasmodium ovale curtisi TaxID=864141 RepID=A0A1A8VQD4_PLAOA|nr:peptide deformylase, putative [Plasmodium ovale curtisi]SBS84881.1 peptide deformylase, putative [Plasmodium ovale curtisi]
MVTVRLTSEKNEIKIVMYPNHVLRKKSEDVVTFDDDLRNLVRNMFNIMYASKGIGLSAPQVNISKRIIVWNALYEKRKEENERVFINPSIVESSLIKTKAIEGCLSFPNVEGKIERPSIVSISYYDLNGNKHLKILKGIHSRIFQHEFDHLNGVLFIDRMSQTEKHKIRAKFNELIRQYRNNFVRYGKGQKQLGVIPNELTYTKGVHTNKNSSSSRSGRWNCAYGLLEDNALVLLCYAGRGNSCALAQGGFVGRDSYNRERASWNCTQTGNRAKMQFSTEGGSYIVAHMDQYADPYTRGLAHKLVRIDGGVSPSSVCEIRTTSMKEIASCKKEKHDSTKKYLHNSLLSDMELQHPQYSAHWRKVKRKCKTVTRGNVLHTGCSWPLRNLSYLCK